MRISRDTVATVGFTVTDENGQVVGRTDPKHPVQALVGRGSLVRGLERAIDGHEKGDSFTVTLNPADAYGVTDPSLVQEIDRAMFGDFPIEVGAVFEADTAQGPIGVVIKEIKDHTVVVDGNHPLSGKTLTFLVSIEDVREATPEEKAHGHVHPDGHCPSEEQASTTAAGIITMTVRKASITAAGIITTTVRRASITAAAAVISTLTLNFSVSFCISRACAACAGRILFTP